MLRNVISSFRLNMFGALKLISWKYTFKRLNEEYEIANKKKQALDKLFENGKISQSIRDSFTNDINTAIVQIEKQQKELIESMQAKTQELENQIKTLETLLANYEIQHVAGEIDEQIYLQEMNLLTTGLDTTRNELNVIKQSTNQLCTPPSIQAPPAPEPVAPILEAKISEPAPIEATPIEVPVEAAPVETVMETSPVTLAPVETAPAEIPIETAKAEATPAESAPIETAPVEPAPVETVQAPIETAPVETAPIEVAKVDAVPEVEKVDEATVETTPIETPTIETIPVEATPVETTPAVEVPVVEAAPIETPIIETAQTAHIEIAPAEAPVSEAPIEAAPIKEEAPTETAPIAAIEPEVQVIIEPVPDIAPQEPIITEPAPQEPIIDLKASPVEEPTPVVEELVMEAETETVTPAEVAVEPTVEHPDAEVPLQDFEVTEPSTIETTLEKTMEPTIETLTAPVIVEETIIPAHPLEAPQVGQTEAEQSHEEAATTTEDSNKEQRINQILHSFLFIFCKFYSIFVAFFCHKN